MRLAYTMAPGRGDTDQLLFQLSERLAAKGHHCCGTVQINTECAEGPCDMDVKVLPDGPILRISQNLGPGARGCRLDPAVLEDAVKLVQNELDKGADILIVNKFGKHEAEGHGFREVIADAIARDMSVIVGVNVLNRDAFLTFAGPDVVEIAPTLAAIESWVSTYPSGERTTSPAETALERL